MTGFQGLEWETWIWGYAGMDGRMRRDTRDWVEEGRVGIFMNYAMVMAVCGEFFVLALEEMVVRLRDWGVDCGRSLIIDMIDGFL